MDMIRHDKIINNEEKKFIGLRNCDQIKVKNHEINNEICK